MRKNYFRRGRVPRWDMRRRALLRAWNEWNPLPFADWIMGWGVIIMFGLCLVLFFAAYLKIGL